MRKEFWEQRRNHIQGCADNGLSMTEASMRLDLTRETIRKYCKKYGIKFSPRGHMADRLQKMADQNMTREEAANELGLTYQTVCSLIRDYSISFPHAYQLSVDMDRAEAMASIYQAGKTLQEIGVLFGVSRERVRQIISKHHGLTGTDGGQHARAEAKRARTMARRNKRCLEKYGCTYDQYRDLVEIGRKMRRDGATHNQTPTGAWFSQRRNAQNREIEWNLTLWDWWQIWQRSGHWDERGRSGDAYVMCRFEDSGAYEPGNVYIATLRHNSSIQPNNPYRKSHPDFEEVMKERRERSVKRKCSIEGCERDHYALDLCINHYSSQWRYRKIAKQRDAERAAA